MHCLLSFLNCLAAPWFWRNVLSSQALLFSKSHQKQKLSLCTSALLLQTTKAAKPLKGFSYFQQKQRCHVGQNHLLQGVFVGLSSEKQLEKKRHNDNSWALTTNREEDKTLGNSPNTETIVWLFWGWMLSCMASMLLRWVVSFLPRLMWLSLKTLLRTVCFLIIFTVPDSGIGYNKEINIYILKLSRILHKSVYLHNRLLRSCIPGFDTAGLRSTYNKMKYKQENVLHNYV